MQISSNYNVSFGHVYSQALDSIINQSGKITKREEAELNETIGKASKLKKSVITSSTQKGLVLLTANAAGNRQIENTYFLGFDTKTNLAQLKDAVKDAEKIEKSSSPIINPVKKGTNEQSVRGTSEVLKGKYSYQYIYNNTINGYNAGF